MSDTIMRSKTHEATKIQTIGTTPQGNTKLKRILANEMGRLTVYKLNSQLVQRRILTNALNILYKI